MPTIKKIGIVISIKANYYFVQYEDSVFLCTIRAILKKEQKDIKVGDSVVIEEISQKDKIGVIEDILPRKNELTRPAVANINQAVIIMATKEPAFSTVLLDKIITNLIFYKIEPVICLNKVDIISTDIEKFIKETYLPLDYKIIFTSALKKWGIEELYEILKNKVSIFIGPSGTGKSSLINAIKPDFNLTIGEMSLKTGTGRHTTRHISLLNVGSIYTHSYVADSPGIILLDFPDIPSPELMWCFKEFHPFITKCRYSSCLHRQEPECAIKKNIPIDSSRYKNYIMFLLEILEKEKKDVSPLRKEKTTKIKSIKGGKRIELAKLGQFPRKGSKRLIRQKLQNEQLMIESEEL